MQVMGLGRTERHVAHAQLSKVNPSRHTNDYGSAQKTPQYCGVLIAIRRIDVKLTAKPSDKGVGDAHDWPAKGVVMGRATVDLPDSTDHAKDATTTTIAGADDLLAQLAGDEIDRLLAESDVERETKPAESLAAPPASSSDQEHDADGELDAVMNELKTVPVGKPAAAPAEPATPVAEQPAQAPLSPPAPAPVVNEAVPHTAASNAEAETAASAAERAALDGKEDESADLLATTSLLAGDERELSPLLKPLAWLSAPLDAFPDNVREALGKIAILTLVNAIAVLAYVMLFRRHH